MVDVAAAVGEGLVVIGEFIVELAESVWVKARHYWEFNFFWLCFYSNHFFLGLHQYFRKCRLGRFDYGGFRYCSLGGS